MFSKRTVLTLLLVFAVALGLIFYFTGEDVVAPFEYTVR